MEHYLYLAHHGVKGQKWGVRRYQNPDGTLTDAGRKHYGRYMRKEATKAVLKGTPEATQEFTNKARDFLDNVKWGTVELHYASREGFENSSASILRKLGINAKTPVGDLMRKTAEDYRHEKEFNPSGKTIKERYPGCGDGWEGSADEFNQTLFDDIESKSIDWYFNTPKSKAAKAWCKERDRLRSLPYSEKVDKQRRTHNENLLGVVLKDLDLEDTAENRKVIEPYVFWD